MAAIACGDDGAATDASGTSSGSTGSSSTSTTGTSTTGTSTTTTSTTDSTSHSTDGPTTTGESATSGASSDSTDTSSTGTDGGTTGTTGGSGDSGSSETTSGVCAPVMTTSINHDAFSGDGACEGVQGNHVLSSTADVDTHSADYCATLNACFLPGPPCPAPPNLDMDGNRVAYVFGQTSGCSAAANITEVVDCGDEVEVHYTVSGIGACALIVYAWDSVLIPDGPTITFIDDGP